MKKSSQSLLCDENNGPEPSELYGKMTWKIGYFSRIRKQELRSNAFQVGGCKWYIVIYPQGCDVHNYLSIFLGVANHEDLLPGWSHVAQFTISLMNKNPKKSKYTDTLHRFWKKEHDWGWKKFMELPKLLDGFIENDTLVIKAQIQVIREETHRPFRCLDCKYQAELLYAYSSNLEQIFLRFIEERRCMPRKIFNDKVIWSSFREFWSGTDNNARQCMSSYKAKPILKVIVDEIFIYKEVASTLIMDFLYSGLKVLQSGSKNINGTVDLGKIEEKSSPIIVVEKDLFVLADDVLVLLERVATEPLPPKNMVSQDKYTIENCTKEGNSGDVKKESEDYKKRLTELGRIALESFVFAHIFSNKVEIAYQEAIAFKQQEDLICEEESTCLAEEKKAKHIAKGKKRKGSRKK